MSDQLPFDIDNIRLPNIPKSTVAIIILIATGALVVYTMVFTVAPEEVGVVLRFGKYNRTSPPGLNFKVPFGIERVYKVPIERQLKLEFGFRSAKPGIRTQYSRSGFKEESLMLTGDLNAAEVEWIVQFRITDPRKYLFNVRQPPSTFRDMNEAVMRSVIGERTVDDVLTVGRQSIGRAVKEKLQDLCNQYEIGIEVERIVLQDVSPPDLVRDAFNKVNEAQQEREKLINQALSEYNKVVPRAKGEKERTIEAAKGYASQRVNRAEGDAARFNARFKEYQKAKDVTRRRIYLETMQEVLKNVGKKLITDDAATGILPLFNLESSPMGGRTR
jgi:membrane protease subunit HflK